MERHLHVRTPQDPPVSFRPPRAERDWLYAHAAKTGQPVNRILLAGLRLLMMTVDDSILDQGKDQEK